jgi:hypothetical protein
MGQRVFEDIFDIGRSEVHFEQRMFPLMSD